MMLKLKVQYFGHLMRRVDSLEKTLMLGGIGVGREGDDRGWDGWMISPTWWTRVWVNSGSWWWTGRPGVLSFMGSQRVGHDWATELNLNVKWKQFAEVHFFPTIYRCSTVNNREDRESQTSNEHVQTVFVAGWSVSKQSSASHSMWDTVWGIKENVK